MSVKLKYPSKATVKGKVYFFVLKNVFCRLVCWLWVKEIRGIEHIPRSGPFLVVCNHQSYFDFMVLTFAFRSIRFLSGFIKDAYYDAPGLNFFLRELAQIRVDRAKKLDSINEAVGVLNQGQVVVIFPEGTRTRTGEIGNFHRGIELIVEVLPDVPVVPAGINGANRIWSPNCPWPKFFGGRKAIFSVGNAMKFSDYKSEDPVKFSQKVRETVISLAS